VDGGWPVLISLVLFFLFGSFFGDIPWLGPYWAVLLIGIGILILLRPLARARRKRERTDGEDEERGMK
jgi:flagellar biosynthesis/type III secretory pathway M-ring protein FliF/YscJ